MLKQPKFCHSFAFVLYFLNHRKLSAAISPEFCHAIFWHSHKIWFPLFGCNLLWNNNNNSARTPHRPCCMPRNLSIRVKISQNFFHTTDLRLLLVWVQEMDTFWDESDYVFASSIDVATRSAVKMLHHFMHLTTKYDEKAKSPCRRF